MELELHNSILRERGNNNNKMDGFSLHVLRDDHEQGYLYLNPSKKHSIPDSHWISKNRSLMDSHRIILLSTKKLCLRDVQPEIYSTFPENLIRQQRRQGSHVSQTFFRSIEYPSKLIKQNINIVKIRCVKQ